MKNTVIAREVDELIGSLGQLQHGIVTGKQLRRRGVTAKQVLHRVGSRLQRLKTDIYRLRDHPWTWEAQLQAALFDAGPGAVVSHRSAAQLHGFWRYRHRGAVEVTGREQHDHRVTLARLHRSALVPPSHRTVVAGFPVTTVARTCFDLCGDPEPGLRRGPEGRQAHAVIMRQVLNDALGRRDLTVTQLAFVLATIGKRGRPGSALMRELLDGLPDDYIPLASDGESLVMELIDAFGIDQPERQVPMSDAEGWIGTVDFFWRVPMLVLEVDGRWHDGPIDQTHDRERDERLRALGLVVWRWRFRDLVREPSRHARQLRAFLAPIGAEEHQHSFTPRAG